VITGQDVSDVDSGFAADPFMICVKGIWYLFFELLNLRNGRGEIGLATSADGQKWQYQQRVLAEPFHMSYPYVFQWRNEAFMLPETRRAGEVRLYKARNFPHDWVLEQVLLQGPNFADSSVFQHRGGWWMYTEYSDLRHDTLRLFYADSVTGPWFEHPKSPVVAGNPHSARPGGRVIVRRDEVIRYAQDCHPFYGLSVKAFRVLELTRTTYRETPASLRPVFKASGRAWNRCGMHHVDAHELAPGQWLACADGWYDSNDPDWQQ
jgi:hypothetical protein